MILKALILFGFGFLYSSIADSMFLSHHISISNTAATPYWISTTSGFACCFIGLLYPILDQITNIRTQKGWTRVLRCCGALIGVTFAVTKLSLHYGFALFLTLVLLSIGFWFVFDRTWHGFVLGGLVAGIGSYIVSVLVHQGHYT
jgi:hypothetical protein